LSGRENAFLRACNIDLSKDIVWPRLARVISAYPLLAGVLQELNEIL
jgi:hypothetical protein